MDESRSESPSSIASFWFPSCGVPGARRSQIIPGQSRGSVHGATLETKATTMSIKTMSTPAQSAKGRLRLPKQQLLQLRVHSRQKQESCDCRCCGARSQMVRHNWTTESIPLDQYLTQQFSPGYPQVRNQDKSDRKTATGILHQKKGPF